MTHREYESTALLALPGIAEGSYPEKGMLSWGRPLLISNIREQGVDVHAVRGVKAIDVEQDTVSLVVRPEYSPANDDVVLYSLGGRALSSYGMLRSIIAPVDSDALVPTLNPTPLRRLARDKYQTSKDLLDPFDLYRRQNAKVIHEDDLIQAFDDIPGDQIVLKPNGGMRSKGVFVGGKSEVAQNFSFDEKIYIAEEKMDFTTAWPGVRGIDGENQKRLDVANKEGHNKELRVYAFGPQEWSVVGRVAETNELDFRRDNWLYLDPDTVPTNLVDKTQEVLGRIKNLFGTDEVNIALDFVYTTIPSDADAKWRVMEVNAAEPQLVNPNEHETVGNEQYKKLATQIARIARRNV